MELLLDRDCKNRIDLKKIIPYIILFFISLIGCMVIFYDGYPIGDDTNFHFANIYDIYTQLKSGGLSPISGNLASGYGVGKQLFYSPIAHLVPALFGVILEPFGVSLLGAFKFTLFVSVFISGIFAYRFSYHVSKGKTIISVIVASVYILYPYRYFDSFCRIAYAEALAFWFLPLFFMGIYDLCHMKELNSKPFVEIILGGSLLFLTHNLTAFYAFVFGIIYLLFYVPNIIKGIKKNKLYIVYALVSIFIMVGIMSVTLFQTLSFMSQDYYNVSVPERMWSNIEAVINRNLDAGVYSGFLNFPFLNGTGVEDASYTQLMMDIMFFTLASIVFVSVDYLLKKFKYIHLLIGIVVYSALIYVLVSRIELYMAAIAFIILYSIKDIFKDYKNSSGKIYKSINFWYSIFMLILVIYLIARHDLWYILPKQFLNIQFPWRLWAFIPLYLVILLSEISNYYGNKIYIPILCLGSSLLIVFNMSYIEKRIAYNNNYENYNIDGWCYDINSEYLKRGMSIGANLEYLPQKFYYNSDYKSEYKNSLFKRILNEVSWNIGKHPYAIDPTLLTGSGSIVINSKFAPKYDMNINLLEKSLIQMPLFYYDGYEIIATNLDDGSVKSIEVKDVDSLISFELESGNYNVKTNYKGTKIRNLSISYRYVAIYLLLIFIGFDVWYSLYLASKRRRNN